jgi:hypothetical protein
MIMIAYAFLQSRRLKAAGRKKKWRPTAATEPAGHQASHSLPLRAPSAEEMPTLRQAHRRKRPARSAKVVLICSLETGLPPVS